MSEWISVEDRLPNIGQNVLTYDGHNRVFCSVRQNHQFKIHYTVWDHDNVTHWMPLPEPPTIEVNT